MSIKSLDPVEIGQLTIVTGLNGTGKSQLLKAIESGEIEIDTMVGGKAVYLDLSSFQVPKEQTFTTDSITSLTNSAWISLFGDTDSGNRSKHQVDAAKQIIEGREEKIATAAISANVPIWELDESCISDPADWTALTNYKDLMDAALNNVGENSEFYGGLVHLFRESMNFIHKLSEVEFGREFIFRTRNDQALPSQLGRVFMAYQQKFEQNQYEEFRNKEYGESNKVLDSRMFTKKYGPKPWDIINSLTDRIGSLPYKVTSPQFEERTQKFQVKLIHKYVDNLIVDFGALSSGEKSLMALVAATYRASDGGRYPEILLLDEVDASMHPSMIVLLLDFVNEFFTRNGIVTIMASHSPTTIALAPDHSILLMTKDGSNRLRV